jgi:hypothetical protein
MMMIIDLTNDDVPVVPVKRNITYVDLTMDTEVVKRPRRETSLAEHLMKLSCDLIKKIFEEYLDITLINKILHTPKAILLTSVHIHHAMVAHIIPKKAVVSKSALSTFILKYIGYYAPTFIHFAKVNATIVSSLKVNDTFDYYEPHRNGRYIVIKTLKERAIVQKIKYQDVKLSYKGLLIDTVTKMAKKKTLSFRILNERCIFSSIREKNICFINNSNLPVYVSYFIDDTNISEKRSEMSEYSII